MEIRKAFNFVVQFSEKLEQSLNFYKYLAQIEGENHRDKDTDYFREILYNFNI